jgi:hypothetical protein
MLLAAAAPPARAAGRGLLAPVTGAVATEGLPSAIAHGGGGGGDHAATPTTTLGAAGAADLATTTTQTKKSSVSQWIQHAAHGASRLLVHSSEMESEAARRAQMLSASGRR